MAVPAHLVLASEGDIFTDVPSVKKKNYVTKSICVTCSLYLFCSMVIADLHSEQAKIPKTNVPTDLPLSHIIHSTTSILQYLHAWLHTRMFPSHACSHMTRRCLEAQASLSRNSSSANARFKVQVQLCLCNIFFFLPQLNPKTRRLSIERQD